jgi:iron transport multicopper oxidase
LPILLQILAGVPVGNLFPSGSIYPLKRGESVELYIPQVSGRAAGTGPVSPILVMQLEFYVTFQQHPVHLHGHSFHVIRSAGSTEYNYKKNPVLRDVVNIGDLTDNVTIRFQANNPGPWFLHCHIDWHLSA